jgi:hypothetical protein
MSKCKKCGSERHTEKVKTCCNCLFFFIPNYACKQGTYTTREGYCTLWRPHKIKTVEIEKS